MGKNSPCDHSVDRDSVDCGGDRNPMLSALYERIKNLPKPWNWLVGIILLVVVISGMVWATSQVQSCGYHKAKKEYDKHEAEAKAERDKLIGENVELRREKAELELQKQAFKTMAEQGIKLDQEKAKQIDEISAKEASDLEKVRGDMDCRTRAADTVALLRTAKPPIILDLESVIRKQCPR